MKNIRKLVISGLYQKYDHNNNNNNNNNNINFILGAHSPMRFSVGPLACVHPPPPLEGRGRMYTGYGALQIIIYKKNKIKTESLSKTKKFKS